MPSHSFLSDMGPRSAADLERPSILSADPALFIPPEIRALSDLDLIAATRALNRSVVNYAWTIVPVAAVAAGATLGASAAVVACVLAIAACKLGLYLHERSGAVKRGQLAKREFCARYHIGALSLDEAAARMQLAASEQTELVVLFRAWALPHGGHRFIRVELGAENKIATYATPFLGDLQRHSFASTHMTKIEAPLSAAQAERLRSACADLIPTELEQLPGRALATASLGLPCDLVVLRRGAETVRAGMNLGSDANMQLLTPPERLASALLDIEGEIAGAAPSEPDLLTIQARADLAVRG